MPETSTILVHNNDRRIWNRDQVIVEIMRALALDHDIDVVLDFEGPCAQSLGLYDLLDLIGVDPKRIRIATCNLLEQHDVYSISRLAPVKHLDYLRQRMRDDDVPHKTITTGTKHFGHFVGHGSLPRLVIGSHLYTHHRDQTLQTYHSTHNNNQLHGEFLAVEELMQSNLCDNHLSNALSLLEASPLRWDHLGSGPILDLKMYGILNAYQNIFVDIVCHTFYSGRTFYLDEKLWRPIAARTPFMVHGPKNFIQNLRLLGFRTFDAWWDEGYSEDHPEVQIVAMLENIDRLAVMSHSELESMYRDMQPTLEHNFQTLLSLQEADFFREYV